MKIFNRLLTLITPACGHEAEIHDLRDKLQAAIRQREVAERRAATSASEAVDVKGRLELLAGELTAISADVAHHHPAHLEYVDTLQSIQLQRRLAEESIGALEDRLESASNNRAAERRQLHATIEDLAREIEGLQSTRELLADEMRQSRELRQQVEELTHRLAVAEAAAREDGLDEQLSLMHSPVVEAGGEVPILQDRLISDSTSEQSYRLVGIFFEGRSHWVLARGDERIKAPIHDHAFLERMRRSEVSFTSGDTLRAMVRVQGWRKPNNDSYAVYSVEEVLEIIHPDEQLELPAPAGEEAQHA